MKFFYLLLMLSTMILMISCSGNDSSKSCSASNINGTCSNGQVCNQGVCVSAAEKCSDEFPKGYCDGNNICQDGVCINKDLCSDSNLNGTCEDSSKFCDSGICKSKLSKYKIGAISQAIEDHNLINEYHFDIMDITGRNKHRLTNDVQSCINKDSCWVSPNYKYFLYLKETGGSSYSLNIVDIPENFRVNFASSELVTMKMIGLPHFLNNGKSFIYVDGTTQTPMIKKYNMENKSSSSITKFSVVKQGKDANNNPVDYDQLAGNYIISPDDKTLVFDIIMDYKEKNNPSEIYKVDITTQDAIPVKIYKFNKFNQDGNGMNWGVISNDNTTLAFISAAGLQHRIHIVKLDGSSLVEDGGDPIGANECGTGEGETPHECSFLGKFIGPDYNSCSNIEGTQICDMKSELFYSKDGKYLYFAGKTGQYSELSQYINIYKYDILNKTLIKITDENTDYQDAPFKFVTFNMDTENVIYILEQQGYIKNYDIHYLDLNSKKKDLGRGDITNTRDARELKVFLLKQ